jgi:hypothetical protein
MKRLQKVIYTQGKTRIFFRFSFENAVLRKVNKVGGFSRNDQWEPGLKSVGTNWSHAKTKEIKYNKDRTRDI